jgi:hypothetical protein
VAKKNAADSRGNPEVISWRALGNETENAIGQRIDSADKFGPRFNANPSFKEICSFDPQGIKLKTSQETSSQQTGGNTGRSTVNQMAKKATAKRIG